jgi:type IX secretion system PorP/SprF family membrane protein
MGKNNTISYYKHFNCRLIVSLLAFLLWQGNGFTQDAQFSQFYSSPLNLGPSMAGSANEGRLVLNYRDQWPRLSGRFVTYAVSYDQYVEEYNSGIGLNFLHDNAGKSKLTSTMAGISYSYRIRAGRNLYFQPGLQAYYFQRRINFEKLTFADQFYGDTVLPTSIQMPPGLNRGQMNFSSSLLVFNEIFWAGATLDHMMQLNTSLADDPAFMPIKITAFGGVTFTITPQYRNRDRETVSLAYQYRRQSAINQLDLGAYYFRMPIRVGIWYRGMPDGGGNSWNRDAIVLSAGIVFDQFLLSYSYDLTISNLIQSTGGAHEVAILYRFGKLFTDLKGIGQVPCPRF